MYKFNMLDKISFILIIIGAINWGLLGLFNFEIAQFIFGTPINLASRLIYILIGAAGINMLVFLIKTKRNSE